MHISKHKATLSFKNGFIKLPYINRRLSQAGTFSDPEAAFPDMSCWDTRKYKQKAFSLWEARAGNTAPNSAQAT